MTCLERVRTYTSSHIGVNVLKPLHYPGLLMQSFYPYFTCLCGSVLQRSVQSLPQLSLYNCKYFKWFRSISCVKLTHEELFSKTHYAPFEKNGLAIPMIDYYHLEKSLLHINECIYMYICMKSSFPKHDLRTCHCHCNLDFWIGA